ncbi:PP0621 family protein [Roseateles chitinivorans]|uniref:PP0621 family protein n=1 Tax=Roseateles chitinivorans TaxID=2917965 RepID=UPI002681DB39
MIKLLFWIVLLAVVAFMLGFKRGRPASRDARPQSPSAPPAPAAPAPSPELESMVSCAECGTHLPAGEAVPGRGGLFCSASHRAAHEARLDAAAAERARGGASGS